MYDNPPEDENVECLVLRRVPCVRRHISVVTLVRRVSGTYKSESPTVREDVVHKDIMYKLRNPWYTRDRGVQITSNLSFLGVCCTSIYPYRVGCVETSLSPVHRETPGDKT